MERDIQAAVIDHWRWLGQPMTLVAAIPNAGALGQPGLTEGLADLLVIAPELPVGFIELKRTSADDRTPEQLAFAALCEELRIPYACAVGRDEPIRVLESWGVVRRQAA